MFQFNNRWTRWEALLPAAIILSAMFISGCATGGSVRASATYIEPFDHFGSLSDHGEWMMQARFGRVWRPYVIDHWRPFYYGHWTWSDYGWTWMSYEPYGWIVYHHGHWFYDPAYGWVWIPGYRWSPAVAVWINYGNYIGWAPLPPPGVVLPDPWDDPRWNIWNIVVFENFHREYIGNFVILSPHARPVQKIKVIRNAPDVSTVERIRKLPIQRVPVQKRPITIEKKTYDRILIPQKEAAKVKQHAHEVEEKVLRPKVKKIKPE